MLLIFATKFRIFSLFLEQESLNAHVSQQSNMKFIKTGQHGVEEHEDQGISRTISMLHIKNLLSISFVTLKS